MTELLAYIPPLSTAIGTGVGLVGGFLLGQWHERRSTRKGTP